MVCDKKGKLSNRLTMNGYNFVRVNAEKDDQNDRRDS